MYTGVRFGGVRKSSSGQAPILAAVLFLLLVPTTIIIAENATGNTTGDIVANITAAIPYENNTLNTSHENNVTGFNTILLSGNMIFPDSKSDPASQGSATSHANTTNATVPMNQTNMTAHLNNTNTTPPGESAAMGANETVLPCEENTTANTTTPANDTCRFPENGTAGQNHTQGPDVQEPGNETREPPTGPALEVSLNLPERTDRNQPFLVSVEILNTGDRDANAVWVEWALPGSISILEGSGSHHCDIPAGAACTSRLTVAASLSSELGEQEIKVLVRYHG